MVSALESLGHHLSLCCRSIAGGTRSCFEESGIRAEWPSYPEAEPVPCHRETPQRGNCCWCRPVRFDRVLLRGARGSRVPPPRFEAGNSATTRLLATRSRRSCVQSCSRVSLQPYHTFQPLHVLLYPKLPAPDPDGPPRDDAVIALSFEKPPVLRKDDGFEYEYTEPPNDHFQLQFNTPFLDNSLAFIDFTRALGIHPTTALILDDMRFLINKVAALGPDPSPQAVQKLQSTADWIYKGIIALPLELAEHQATPRSVGQYPSECYPSPEDSDMGDPMAGTENLTPHSLLPERPSLTRQTSNSPEPRLSPSEAQPPLSPTSKDQKSSAPSVPDADRTPSDPPPAAADPLYGAVRLAAPIYARAIATRQPLSAVCSTKEAMQLLIATWKIPLARWRGVIGIFIFILTAIIPATTSSTSPFVVPHNGFVKSILQIGYMQMAIDNWGVAAEGMRRSLGLQSWLRGATMPAESASEHNADERSKGDQAARQQEEGKQAAGAALGVEVRTDSFFPEGFASDGGGHEDADEDPTKGCYAEHIRRYTADI